MTDNETQQPTKPSWAKECKEMDHNEMVAWAKGMIVIALGEGRLSETVWLIVTQAWQRGYNSGFAKRTEDDLVKYIKQTDPEELMKIVQEIIPMIQKRVEGMK